MARLGARENGPKVAAVRWSTVWRLMRSRSIAASFVQWAAESRCAINPSCLVVLL